MVKHESLFAYGTLTDPKKQVEVIGRVVPGRPDVLRGYRVIDFDTFEGIYPVVIEDSESYVAGMVLEVTPDELDLIDEYETSAYRREKLALQSNLQAWVYIKS